MKIENFFASAQSYEKLCEVAEKAKPKISFWGSEYIVVQGYDGYLGINSITKRLFELVKKNHDFDEVHRNYGKRITLRINHSYDRSDEILKICNFFTKMFVFLRSFGCSINLREYWETYERKFIFDSYTPSQFNLIFGYSINGARERGVRLAQLEYDTNRWRILPNPSN